MAIEPSGSETEINVDTIQEKTTNAGVNIEKVHVENGAINWGGTSTGAANTYAISLGVSPSSYQAGMEVKFIAHQENTGSATINVNSIGTNTIQKVVLGAKANLGAGDIKLNEVVTLIYDGTNFIYADARRSELLIAPYEDIDGTLFSYTSNSPRGNISLSITVNEGENVLLFGNVLCSGTVNVQQRAQINVNGSPVTSSVTGYYMPHRTNTAGTDGDITVFAIDTTVGSNTYTIYVNPASGTLYTASGYLGAIKFKRNLT